jgi:hypothetical protein
MAEGQSAATCARWLTRAPFVSVYPGDVVQRVLNVLEIDAVVFHSAAASARIRCCRYGLKLAVTSDRATFPCDQSTKR